MKLAFLYAGQGSQHAGMGQDFYDIFPAFRAAFDAPALDFDLKETCFTDPRGIIGETQYTQPCMVAFAAGVTAVLQEAGIAPDYVAGLSLGEYSALCAAGAFDAKTAVELAAFRGKAMAEAALGIESAMYAVLNLDRTVLSDCCKAAAAEGIVEICNYNCPGQLVIGGEKAAVEKAAALAKQAGAKRCLPLAVSGPFHTTLMQPAGQKLAEKFAQMSFAPLRCPVLFNCLGRENTELLPIPELLVRQVQSSVYMEDTIRRLAALGVDTIVEIGPGKALSGFVKKTVGDTIRCLPVETVEQLQAALTVLKGA